MAYSPSTVMQAYSPPLSLWSLIEQHVPEFELEEVKYILGSPIVDQSLELHNEIEMLLDIWRDMRDETQEFKLMQSRLPEPPNQRERLIQEINFFAESIKDKAKKKGINPSDILKHHNNIVIDYAFDLSRPGSAMSRSSLSSDGRETPMMSASSDRISKAFEVSDQVESMSQKLNVYKFDDVCTHLRSTLESEVDQLLSDIEFLQRCLDEEADIRDFIETPRLSREPTLTELREERTSLEKELLQSDNLTFTPQVDKPVFNDTLIKLAPTNQSTTSVIDHAKITPKHSPMKGNHQISISTDRQITPPNFSKIQSDLSLKELHDFSPTKLHSNNTEMNSASPRSKVINKNSLNFAPSPPKCPMPERQTKHNKSNSPSDFSTKTISSNPSPTSISDGAATAKLSRNRVRNMSPGRVRVVNLNSIVGSNTSKDKSICDSSEIENDLNDSATIIPFNPVSTNNNVTNTVEKSLRPKSADRFRKMVMDFRDVE